MKKGISQKFKDFFAGILFVILLELAVLFFSYKNQQNLLGSKDLTLYATYNKADGVNVGTKVLLAGIEVGQVSAVRLDKFYRVLMTFSLKPDLQLPTDTAAMIETDGIIGSKYIELLPGGEFDTMQNGDSFIYTQDVLLLDELLERFLGIMRAKKGILEDVLVEEE